MKNTIVLLSMVFCMCLFGISFVWSISPDNHTIKPFDNPLNNQQLPLATYIGKSLTFDEFASKEPDLVSWFGVGAKKSQVESAIEGLIFTDVLALEAKSEGIAENENISSQINQLLANAYLKKHVPRSEINVDESEVRAFYESNKDSRYKNHREIQASHILLDNEVQAEKVLKQLKEGVNFDALARKQSKDPATAKRGGSLGKLSPLYLIPPLRSELEKLKSGEFGGPVQSAFGSHVLRLDLLPENSYQSFEDVKQEIYSEIVRTKEAAIREKIKSALWDKYKVTLNHDTISKLVDEEGAKNKKVADYTVSKQRREPGQATELQTIAESLELGKIPYQKHTEKMLLANTSQRVITISRVGSTCKCIEAKVDENSLQPGQVTKLSISYDPKILEDNGPVEKLLYLESSDSIGPRKFIKLHADITKEK